MPVLSGAVIGTGLAAVVAGVAWRLGSLSRSGALAAWAVGAAAMTAGRDWGTFLVAWFLTASLASRLGRQAKAVATGDIVAKGGARDATQVAANGGVFTACAALSLGWSPSDPTIDGVLRLMGASALVAAGADTLATETGTLWRGQPWSLRTFSPVPTGTSGAVSLMGTAGMTAGALGLAAVAHLCDLLPLSAILPVAAAGVAGAVADTVVGAWWQARRWCPACARETEQDPHRCGSHTHPWRGIPWLTNDIVNFVCTVVGAITVVGMTRR